MYIFSLIFDSNLVSKIKKEKHHLKVLENMKNLLSPEEDYKYLRDRIVQSKGPLIPPIEMYQGQLLYLNSCASLQQKEGIIQFYALQLSAVPILEIKVRKPRILTNRIIKKCHMFLTSFPSFGTISRN